MYSKIQKNTKSNTLKGLRIQTVSLWIAVCTVLVAILIGYGIVNVKKHYRDLAHMTEKYILAQRYVMDLSLGSDYLTEQARLYVITKDPAHADVYFTETDVTRRREKALHKIKNQLLSDDDISVRMATDALNQSNALMDLELHAMKLAALSSRTDPSQLSEKLKEYPLSKEEFNASAKEQSDATSALVFGPEYRAKKQEIDATLSNVTENAIQVCETKQAESEASMKKALTLQSIYTVMIVLLVTLAYAMIALLILKPIKMYINCIENHNILEITGAYEFKYLAVTYNNVYEMSLAQQNLLRQKAEHDALTGLLNRQSFEQIKEKLQGLAQPLALLLIDIDVFKSINDNYGHETGDLALIKAANLLKDSFRSADYVFRIGGDEFAAILQKVTPENKETISSKIDKINTVLKHPENGFPEYSVSVGVAFSASGYSDELFRQADLALYETKENGRCGYTFYASSS